jgi:hypothetical protein
MNIGMTLFREPNLNATGGLFWQLMPKFYTKAATDNETAFQLLLKNTLHQETKF